MPLATILAAAAAAASPAAATPPPAIGTAVDGWQLVWSDEFGGDRLDPAKWVLADDCWGGGNEERQCYTRDPANHRVTGGVLHIVARRGARTGPAYPASQRTTPERRAATATKPYTSARLATAGKAAWQYGRIAVRARLPQGQGTWPAIWMLPKDWAYGGWARSGEIDIMEAVNLGEPCPACASGREDRVLGTIHFGGEPPRNRYIGDETPITDPAGWHVYELEWTAEGMTWRVDGTAYETRVPHEWHTLASGEPGAPFDKPFHLILNLAVGGHLPEGRNRKGVDDSGYPKSMDVDWVRVWQRPD